MIDASIPLSVKPIEIPSPLQTIGALMQYRGLAAQVAQHQALAEQERQNSLKIQAETQQRNRDLTDQNTIQEMMKTPDTAAAIAAGDMTPLNGKVQPKTLETIQTNVLNHHKELATATSTDLENRSKALNQIAETAAGLKSLGDIDKINAALPAAIQGIRAPLQTLKVDPSAAPTSITSMDQLDQFLAGVGAQRAAVDKVLETKKAQTGLENTQSEIDLRNAEIPGKQAEGKIAQIKLGFMQGANPAQAAAGIDALIPPQQFAKQNAAAKAAAQLVLSTTGDPAKAAEAVQKIYAEEVGPVLRASDPAMIAAEAKAAGARAAATAPIEQQRAITTATANRGQTDAIKLDTEYTTAKATTEALGRILDLADKGNKAAGSNLPLVGVETLNAINGIKRVNSAEINQYGDAGNLLDKIKGKIGSLVVGQPIPQDVRDDIRELHEELGTEAYNKYTSGLDSLSKRTGMQFKPTQEPPHLRAASPASSGAPPLPSTLSASDVGKVYTSPKTGKRMKITAVNPANNKQFTSQEVP